MSSNPTNSAASSSSQSGMEWDESLLQCSPAERESLAQLLKLASSLGLESSLTEQLVPLLSKLPHLKRGLEPLSRFIANTRIPGNFLVFLDRDRDALPTLMQILSVDTPAIEWLVEDPDSFDWLRMCAGQAVDASHLKDVLITEVQILEDDQQVRSNLRRFRQRETLRILCAFWLHDMPAPIVAQQLSWVADAAVAAALVVATAERKTDRRHKPSTYSHISPPELAILGLGALGGQELELNGTLELLFLADLDAFRDDPREAYLRDEVHRICRRTVDLLSHEQSCGYHVILPLDRTDIDNSGAIEVHDHRQWLQEMENQGRTWQRLVLMKTRYLAGEPKLTAKFLDELPELVYRRYLTRADIAGIGAIQRKLDRDSKAFMSSPSDTSLSIEVVQRWKREIEFLGQFLQWIHGGELDQVRGANTIQAIESLAQAGCITEQERSILSIAANRFYRTILAAQAAHLLPLATRHKPNDAPADHGTALALDDAQRKELEESWAKVQQIRDHLRAEGFTDESQSSDEADLILDPNPRPEWVDEVLARYEFKRPHAAFRNLMELAREEVSMLSTRRCRHFLSLIAKQLLEKIHATPDPDLTLENLAVSCRSLGGKGVLWELFSVHEPSLDLYVRLCGASPYLIGILTNNPGMIDELLDSLMLNRLPTEQQLGLMLHELCRGAQDIEPIVHSFKNAQHLNVGVRDILGKENITNTHRALADIADTCLQQITDAQYNSLIKRFGVPTRTDGAINRFAVLALGKLGAREPNYHSDITLLFVYDDNGNTQPIGSGRHHESIRSEFFFHQLAQKVVQVVNRVGRSGRLYETKNWIMGPHQSASLARSIEELENYFSEASDTALQRQELCTARCILGEPLFQKEVVDGVQRILSSCAWTPIDHAQALEQRQQLEATAGDGNLKRGVGGTLDVEYIVQLLILKYIATHDNLWLTGTLDGIERLKAASILPEQDAEELKEGYNFLRGVESGLRLMNTSARHDLPKNENEMSRLAYVLRLNSAAQLSSQCDIYRASNRKLFRKYLLDSDSR